MPFRRIFMLCTLLMLLLAASAVITSFYARKQLSYTEHQYQVSQSILFKASDLNQDITDAIGSYAQFLMTGDVIRLKGFYDVSLRVPDQIFQLSFLPLPSASGFRLTQLSESWSFLTQKMNETIAKAKSDSLDQDVALKQLAELEIQIPRFRALISEMKNGLMTEMGTSKITVSQSLDYAFWLSAGGVTLVSALFFYMFVFFLRNMDLSIRTLLDFLRHEGAPLSARSIAVLPEPEMDEIRKAFISFQDKAEQLQDQQVALIKKHLKEQEEFSSMLAHEIRTPLTTLVGLFKVIQNSFSLPTQEANLINESGRKISDLVESAIQYQSLKQGCVEAELNPLNIHDLVKSVVDSFQVKALEAGVELSFVCIANANKWVISDAAKVKQIVSQVINNAIKFNRRGGRVEVTNKFRDGVSSAIWEISVLDSGIGIPLEEQQRIFEPFYQASHGVSRKHEGTGIGLALCRGLIEHLGGDITLSSGCGVGSVFHIIMPVDIALSQSVEQPVSKRMSRIDFEGYKVLMVEDHKLNAKINSHLIAKQFNCQFDIAYTGEVALTKFDDPQKYRLIFMDINLGEGIDGFETTMRLRERYGQLCPPILALTAGLTPLVLQQSKEVGMTACLAKPPDLEQIEKLVGEACHF